MLVSFSTTDAAAFFDAGMLLNSAGILDGRRGIASGWDADGTAWYAVTDTAAAVAALASIGHSVAVNLSDRIGAIVADIAADGTDRDETF